jgi:hypothetical protein
MSSLKNLKHIAVLPNSVMFVLKLLLLMQVSSSCWIGEWSNITIQLLPYYMYVSRYWLSNLLVSPPLPPSLSRSHLDCQTVTVETTWARKTSLSAH